MGQRRIHARVTGKVQGVAYRMSVAREAKDLDLVGWVRNRADGGVELEAEGEADAVAKLVAWCQAGPPAARVEGVTVTEQTPTGADATFSIRRDG